MANLIIYNCCVHWAQSVAPHNTSISASATNYYATSVPQVNPEGTEYMAILELSTTPSDSLS
jgi:hypothetical protein